MCPWYFVSSKSKICTPDKYFLRKNIVPLMSISCAPVRSTWHFRHYFPPRWSRCYSPGSLLTDQMIGTRSCKTINVSFVFFLLHFSISFPPAGTENPGKLDATSNDLASAPMRAPTLPVVVSAERVYNIYIIVYNIYIIVYNIYINYISNESQAECKSIGLSL